MGSIAVHEFMSLDGSIDDPKWTFEYPFSPKMLEALGQVMDQSKTKAILLGRQTYSEFTMWGQRSAEDDPGAPFMNETPKYVVSGTLENADEWQNSTVIGPYDPDAIRSLKDDIDGRIYVSGSATLVRAMLKDGLVDELHLFVYPIALSGSPKRMFDGEQTIKLKLNHSEALDGGILYLVYEKA